PRQGDDAADEADHLGQSLHVARVPNRPRLYDARMKVDYYYPSGQLAAVPEAARTARRLGYDGFFTAETQHDPFLPLALAGDAEPDLELGTAIAVAFPRSPMVTAMMAWDLAQMSAGKFMLGLGTQVRGHIVRRFSTVWDSPGPRLREYILSMRAIWDCWQNSKPLDFAGDFYKFSLMTPFFDPGPIKFPEIPVYIAGVGPYLSRLAGEECQGFHVHPFHTIRYLDEVVLPAIEAGAASRGREMTDVERVTTVFVVTGETDAEIEQAMEPVRQQISFYASTPSYRPVLEANDWDFGAELSAMSKRGQWDRMPGVVPDEAVTSVAVVAPIARLGEAIKDRYGDRVQRVGLYTIGSVIGLDDDALQTVIGQLRG
ncbi:MAG: TIGR03617 family F420-dependent LLM class oxidoreductase, partial [Acidimicrobiia bacterium]